MSALKKQIRLIIPAIILLAALMAFAAGVSAAAGKVELTSAETEFISGHPVIKLGVDPEFIP
ncbi:MAG: hypothetical protein HGA22_14585, partial [Clostridiales bacterium]|nr:hypothetical protein [Clostridiales bacterium]